MMGYRLGTRSRAELDGVHPKLVQCVESAIAVTTQDFAVIDGLRTSAEQRALVARGASKTMRSRHLKQADGFGHAVDLVPWVGGKPRWEWPLIYPIAGAMLVSARHHGAKLRWGGVWDREMDALANEAATIESAAAALQRAVRAYSERHPGPDFLDGPHYELMAG